MTKKRTKKGFNQTSVNAAEVRNTIQTYDGDVYKYDDGVFYSDQPMDPAFKPITTKSDLERIFRVAGNITKDTDIETDFRWAQSFENNPEAEALLRDMAPDQFDTLA